MGEAGERESLTAVTDDVDDGFLEVAKNIRYDCSDRVLLVEGGRAGDGDGDGEEEEEWEGEWEASHVILSLSLRAMMVGWVELIGNTGGEKSGIGLGFIGGEEIRIGPWMGFLGGDFSSMNGVVSSCVVCEKLMEAPD